METAAFRPPFLFVRSKKDLRVSWLTSDGQKGTSIGCSCYLDVYPQHSVFPLAPAKIALTVLVAVGAIFTSAALVTARQAAPPQENPLDPMPDGDRLARLVKKITYEGLLKDPARVAAELGMDMTFTIKPVLLAEKSCDEGGRRRSTTLTEGIVTKSWYRTGPEGLPAMEVPRFGSDKVYVANAPRVEYSVYRSTMCNNPHDEFEARLWFLDVSAYSCFTPQRLERVIGTNHSFHNHGASSSSYHAVPTDEYGTSLRFSFQFGAPCASSVEIRQETRDSARQRRGFMKWRTCYDKARQDYCAANPGTGDEHKSRMNKHGDSVCGDRWMDYVDREPYSGEKPPPYKIVDDPCGADAR